jgi:peptide/nickel transport system substrate-binding protein
MSNLRTRRQLSRRQLLLSAAAMSGSVLLQACSSPAQPTPTPKPLAPQVVPTPVPEKQATTAPTPQAVVPTVQPTATTAPQAASTGPTAVPTARSNIPRAQTLIVGFEGGPVQAPNVANPYVPGAAINQGYHQLMIESLYYLNYQTGKLIPWLAESHQFNDDYTQVDIKLRPGIEWADGHPLTAEDVAFTINVLRDNPTLTYGPEMGDHVKEASVLDEQSPRPLITRVTLSKPYPRFIWNNFTVHIWGAVRILPKHIWSGQDPMKFTNFDLSKGWPIWSGPYRLVSASSNQFVYDLRDDWWAVKSGFQKSLPKPLRVVFVEAGSDDKKAAALQANDVDGEPSLTIPAFLKVREKNRDAVSWLDNAPYGWFDPCPGTLGFQTEQPPWNDPNLRWAVSLAMDRDKLSKANSAGIGMPARFNFSFYTPLEALLNENNDLFDKYNTTEYNPRKAMQLIEAAGYTKGANGVYQKGGKPLNTSVLIKSGAQTSPGIALIVNFLKAVGIGATLQPLAEPQYFDRRSRAQFEIETTHVACGSVVSPYGECANLLSDWIRPIGEIRSNNYWGYKNSQFDDAVHKMGQIDPTDVEKMKPMWRTALELQLRDLPMMALTQQIRVVPYSTRYWSNWPTASPKNDYFHPANWWQSFLMILMNIRPGQS